MAIKVQLDHLDMLPNNAPIIVKKLFGCINNNNDNNEQHGWSLRGLSHAFINGINATPTLSTGLVNLFKSRYAHAYVPRENQGGNFCGHDPAKPRFMMNHNPYFTGDKIDELGKKRRPKILYTIVDRIKLYYHDPDIMPVMQIANRHKRRSDRKRSSAARERTVNLLCAMILNMDLSTLRIGQPLKGGGFFNYSLEWLAEKAGLSESRAKRAMSDLLDTTLIHSYPRCELVDKEKQEYIAHNASRVFDFQFFRMLDIDQRELSKARQYASKKQKDNETAYQKEATQKQDAVNKLTMQKIMRGLDGRKPTLRDINKAENEDKASKVARLQKRRNQVLMDMAQNPRFHGNEEALSEAVHQRFIELNLLTDIEKKARQEKIDS